MISPTHHNVPESPESPEIPESLGLPPSLQLRTTATISIAIARARASTQSASNIRQTMAEQQRKIAAMSQKERQQLMEKVQTQAKAALVRTQARNSNRSVRDYVMISSPTERITGHTVPTRRVCLTEDSPATLRSQSSQPMQQCVPNTVS